MVTHSQELIEQMGLTKLFDQEYLLNDLREGEMWNPAKTRLALLSTDLISGVYRAVVDEAGPAWSVIFNSCGKIWGRRVAERLDHECKMIGGMPLGQMPTGEFLTFVRNYFAFHGWGIVELDVSQTPQLGVVEAELAHSIFEDIVDDKEQMSDAMIAGILGSLFAYMSGHELDAAQTADTRFGADKCRFVITAAERLGNVEQLVKDAVPHEDIVAQI